jgi:hypothetical protein
LKPIVDKADFNFSYRRQQHEHAAMISKLCEKLEAATAPGDWPAFTQAPDASGEAVGAAYRMLGEEKRSEAAQPTAAPVAQGFQKQTTNLQGRLPDRLRCHRCRKQRLQKPTTSLRRRRPPRWLGSYWDCPLRLEGCLLACARSPSS